MIGGRRQLVAACVVLAVAAVGLFFGFRLARGGSSRDNTWDRIVKERVLKIGLDASYPPFEYTDPASGKIIGLDVDLGEILAQRFGGARVDIHNVGFDGLYDGLLGGRFDLIVSALPYDPLQTQDFAYSHPYFDAGPRLVAKGGVPGKMISGLDGRNVGVIAGSEGEAALRSALRSVSAVTVPFEEPALLEAALLDGRVDAGVLDGAAARTFVLRHAEYVMDEAPLSGESYVVAVRLDSPRLLEEVNAAIDELQGSGRLEELVTRWLK